MVPNEDPNESDIALDLGSILTFATGADHPPPLGFLGQPEISFETDTAKSLPTACTCGPTLYLPLSLTDPDRFRDRMDFAIICAHGFGSA